ncbi:MAG TPA: ATP-binding protein, partial [Myxococcota bacterium]|nr:ATP-binding protein [Myxococcota bacterium]
SSPAARSTAVATGLALYALLGGSLSFLGWVADVPRLTDWEQTGVSIQPNTALAVVASAAALLLQSVGRRRAAALLGAIVAGIGASTLFQWISGVNLDALNTLFLFGREWGRVGVVEPGRMGPPASTCWTLIGVALVLASCGDDARAQRAVRTLAFGSLAIAALSIIGFLFRAGPLYSLPYATIIAFQTATFIVAVSASLLALLPERAPIRWLLDAGATGKVARRILAFIVVVSPLAGWLALQGGLAGLYGARFEIAALVLAFMTLTGAMLSWNLRTIERHEAALRRGERQMADTLESITDSCVTFDRDWRYVVVNEKAAKLLGMDRSQLLGRVVWEVFPHIPGNPAERELRRAAAQRVGVEFEYFEPTMRRWFANRAYPTPDGGIALYFRDVTQRKQVAQRMEADLAALTRLQALSTKLVQAGDLDALLREILAAAGELTGTAKGTIRLCDPEGVTLRMSVHQGFSGRFLAHFADHGPNYMRRKRVILPDITRVPQIGSDDLRVLVEEGVHAIQATPLLSRDGVLLGVMSNHYPAPGRPAERELRYLDLLARMAADLIERSQAEQALREADRRKDEFLAMLAHELRNPLAPMRNAVEILLLADGDDAVVRRAAELMDRQVSQMVRLVEDLLDVSRITRGRIELRKERVELSRAVEQAVEDIRTLIEGRSQALEIMLPPDPIHLSADTARLTQVVGNLLNNASKFTDPGGHIRLAVEREAAHAVVRVRDDGIGIAADQLARIFDMFVQVDTSLERSVDGLGIGLTLVKNLVELHRGSVEVTSQGLGCGAEFVLRLPLDLD